VHNARDYMVAGRSLPLYMNVATVFATWFGAETVLSVSATFAKDGWSGIPGDPFGASLCLVLAALLFARLFYRMNLLTIGDFYKQRYGKGVEVLTSVAIVLSYLGWTSAQMTALGLVIHVLSGGALELNQAIMLGCAGGAGLHASSAACGRWPSPTSSRRWSSSSASRWWLAGSSATWPVAPARSSRRRSPTASWTSSP
jgi:Na+/proline symporter